jgi:bile acid:Na+ symporter, BASS family
MAVLVALLMLGLGATVSVPKFRRSIANWRGPFIGFVSQTFFMPLIAFLLCVIFQLDQVTALSVVAIGCSPGECAGGG